MKRIIKKAEAWLDPVYDAKTRSKVKKLLKDKNQNLIDAFSQNLNFGTGGAREKMDVGSNRINIYTLTLLSQAVANYLKKTKAGSESMSEPIKIAIAYDTRNNSKFFAEKVGQVFAKNNIQVYLFTEPKPTPLLSFAVRELHCNLGIIITASHNPKEYNGFKVYNHFGGQIIEPTNVEIIDEMKQLGDYKKVHLELKNKAVGDRIVFLDEAIEKKYIESLAKSLKSKSKGKSNKRSNSRDNSLSSLKVTYSALHGNGIFLLPQVAKHFNLTHLNLVEEQAIPDGNFPTVASPNPEDREALELGLKTIKKNGDKILLLTDPDSDRLGLVVRGDDANVDDDLFIPNLFIPNGNEIGILLTYYLIIKNQLDHPGKQEKSKSQYYVLSTLVSSPLLSIIAKKNKLKHYATLTGFKYLGAIMEKLAEEKLAGEKLTGRKLTEGKTAKPNKPEFLFAMEESYGYLFLDSLRDKDAISSAILFCEMYQYFSKQKISLEEVLKNIHLEYGLVETGIFTLTQEGEKGKKVINQIMDSLRKNPPTVIAGEKLVNLKDYQEQTNYNFKTKKKSSSGFANLLDNRLGKLLDKLPKANFLQLFFSRNTRISVRPSGTEPKIKFYVAVQEKVNPKNYSTTKRAALEKIQSIKEFFLNTYT